MSSKASSFVIPEKLGDVADLLYTVRQERLLANRKVKELQEHETALKNHVINTFPKSNADGIIGKLGKVSLGSKQIARVTDWDLLHEWVLETKDFSLFTREVNSAVANEMWDADEEIPGVEPYNLVTVSTTKA